MASTSICSINGCKRAATCLCLHCKKNVCSKHFNEHQGQINSELLPLTDRLNELKMTLKTKENHSGPLATLKAWRDKKYKAIDQEYNRKVQEYNTKVSKQEAEVSQIIVKIEELINDGEVSFDQMKQLKKDIETMENRVTKLMSNEPTSVSLENNSIELDLVSTYIRLGSLRYFIKAKLLCGGEHLYALECETPLTGYNGLCPICRTAHISFQPNRGFYAPCQRIDEEMLNTRRANSEFYDVAPL